MRRTQKNSKRKTKRKGRKVPPARLPRLSGGPSNHSKSVDADVTKSFDAKLPHLSVSVGSRKAKLSGSGYPVDTGTNSTGLPRIIHKRKQKYIGSCEKDLNSKVVDLYEEGPTGKDLRQRQKNESTNSKEFCSLNKKVPKREVLWFHDNKEELPLLAKHGTAKGLTKSINSDKKKKYLPLNKDKARGKIPIFEDKEHKRLDPEILQRTNYYKVGDQNDIDSEKNQKNVSSKRIKSKSKLFNEGKSKATELTRLQPSNYPVSDAKKEFAEKTQKRLTYKNSQGLAPDSVKRFESRTDLSDGKKGLAEEKKKSVASRITNLKEKAQHSNKDYKVERVRINFQKQPRRNPFHANVDCIKEGVSLIEVYSNKPKYNQSSFSSDLENQEAVLITHRDCGIFDSIDGVDLTNVKNQTEEESENIYEEKRSEKEEILSVEIQESGLHQPKETGTMAISIDEGFCEQDLIFEEVVDVNFLQKHHRTKPKPQMFTKGLSRKPPNVENSESGCRVNRDGRNILPTKEFKVQGLEISLRKFPPHKKPKKISLVPSKPKICRQKVGIEGNDGIQGCKVKGCSVDVDEYVIAMVRLANCNDNVNQKEMQGFSCRLYQEMS